jgi:hypothetical protein
MKLFNIVCMSLSVATFSFGPLALQAQAGSGTCAEDINGDGDVNGLDLAMLIAKWGSCDTGGGSGGTAFSMIWSIDSNASATPSSGSSIQNSTGTSAKIYDKNGNSGSWPNSFRAENLYLLKGPSATTDKLRITMTLDFSKMQGKDGPVNANCYLNGFSNGTATPVLINTSYMHWYYGDSNYVPNGICAGSNQTIPELDLFETGSSSTIAGGLPTVIQITTHAGSNGGSAAGAFVGIGGSNYAIASQNITSSQTSSVSYPSGHTYLGMNIALPFTLKYVISSTQIQMTATQGSITSVLTYTPSGGVKDWTKYKYFSAVLGVNNSYWAGKSNGINVSTTHASTYQPFVASNILFELSTDSGSTYANCIPLTTYTAGYFNTTSECAIEAKPLPTGTP